MISLPPPTWLPPPTSLLVDTSVLLKWFHASGESEVEEARALRDATQAGAIEARMLDLALYETGNVLLRRLGWDGADVADQLDDLVAICGAPLAMSTDWLRRAALLGADRRLTFYDACWAAAAASLGVVLVSADRELIGAGLAEPPGTVARRLGLAPGC